QYVNIPEQYLPGESFSYDSAARVRYETLAKGVSGSLVKTLQQALKELGFYGDKEDGVFGTSTTQAVKDFQKQNGYKATGIALPEMQKLLYEGKPRNSKNRKVYVDTLPPIPNPDMELGDKGDAVAGLQQMLKTLGFYKGDIDGAYGKSTMNAVKAYQKAHSIRQTGKMNSFTWLSLETNMQTPAPGQSTPQYELNESNVIVMRKGTRGLAVTRLEERLIELGYYNKTPNGIYENQDMDAVKQFQRNNGFTSSGIADLYTQRALFSENAVPASKTPPSDWQSITTNAPTTPIPTQPIVYGLLKIGSRGNDVVQLQNNLIKLGYLTGKADGIFGTQTALAVTGFQRANKLQADGMAGQDTLSALYSSGAVAQKPNNQQNDSNKDSFTRNLSMGMRGADVAAAQSRLIKLKYLSGAADGIFGPATALAVQAFQEANRLKQDGIIGSLTWTKLNSGNAIAKDTIPIIPPFKPGTIDKPSVPSFTAPTAKEVRFALWDTEVKTRSRKLPHATVYDFLSGGHYNVNVFSNGNHADAEPITEADTEAMRNALGKDNWTPRPVWIIFSDGRVYMASTHSRGHEVDHNPNNGLTGHICIHYPREMSVAEKVGPYAVSHQNAILSGWDLTQSMAVKQ
ncbi:MAG: peptidoglycan-binding protein, partial [Eubacteriales bacterium]|nr:peptidoglycan-binding protein [Eubacteriales bacterium]